MRSVRFRQRVTLPLIVSPMPNGARVWLEAAAREAGVGLDVTMEVHSVHLIKKMVQAGWGYTVALSDSVQEEPDTDLLSASPRALASAACTRCSSCACRPVPAMASLRTGRSTSWKWPNASWPHTSMVIGLPAPSCRTRVAT